MNDTFESDIAVKKDKESIKILPLPLNVIDMIIFSKKKIDNVKGILRWESEGGHL